MDRCANQCSASIFARASNNTYPDFDRMFPRWIFDFPLSRKGSSAVFDFLRIWLRCGSWLVGQQIEDALGFGDGLGKLLETGSADTHFVASTYIYTGSM
jgi:hypothetical protein